MGDRQKTAAVKKSDRKTSDMPEQHAVYAGKRKSSRSETETRRSSQEPVQEKRAISVVQGDITALDCECIVNAANKSLLGGGGVDGAIHRAAGPELLKECRTLGGCETGEAKITRGYHLPAEWVIHTVGPIYSGRGKDAELLANCYRNSLELAKTHGIHRIAFPAISTGVYGYPLKEAAAVALSAVRKWLDDNRDYFMEVIFCCFSQQAYDIYQSRTGESETRRC